MWIWKGGDEAKLGTIHGPDILAVLISVQETTDGELGELASRVYVAFIERVRWVHVRLGIDGERRLSSRLGASVEVWKDIIAVVWLILDKVSYMT